jgi:hypothetical protein
MNKWNYEDETCPLQGLGSIIKLLLIAFLLSFLLCSIFGCSSIRRGDFAVDSFGTDVAFKSAEWHATGPDGHSESLILKGADKNGTETAHTFANLAMGIVSAFTGAAVHKGDPVKGAAVGFLGGISLTEVWQTGKDLLK